LEPARISPVIPGVVPGHFFSKSDGQFRLCKSVGALVCDALQVAAPAAAESVSPGPARLNRLSYKGFQVAGPRGS